MVMTVRIRSESPMSKMRGTGSGSILCDDAACIDGIDEARAKATTWCCCLALILSERRGGMGSFACVCISPGSTGSSGISCGWFSISRGYKCLVARLVIVPPGIIFISAVLSEGISMIRPVFQRLRGNSMS